MAYKPVDPRINDQSVNIADRNQMALNAGYTGLDDFNNNKGSATYIGGGGSTGSAGGSISGGGDFSANYTRILQQLRAQPSPLADVKSFLTEQTNKTIEITNELASNSLSQIPLISQIYSKLADALSVSKTQELQSTEIIGKGEIGRQKSALASEGVSAGTGAATAPVALAEEKLRASVQTVIDKYQIKAEQYAAEEAKSISDLTKEANEYKLKGITAVSDLATKLAQLKLDEERLLQQQASDMAKGDSDEEKRAIQAAYQQQLLELKQQQIDNAAALAAEKLQYSYAALEARESAAGLRITERELALKNSPQQQIMEAQAAVADYTKNKAAQKAASPEDFVQALKFKYPLAVDSISTAKEIRKITGQ